MTEKQPASAMVRVPTPLIDVVKELSRLHRQGKTKPLLQALGELIAAIDSNTESNIVTIDSDVIADLIARVERLEAGMIQPASTSQRPQRRPARATAPDRESVDHAADGWLSQQQVAELIGVNKSTLATKRQQMNDAEFLDYLNSKSSQRWEFDRSKGQKGMFRPLDAE